MAIKFSKLHETATLETGASIPRQFRYKTAFVIFIVCLVGLAALAFGVRALVTMNRLSTTSAEAVPSNEAAIRAVAPARITAMHVAYGDTVEEGEVLFEVEPLPASADQAMIARYKAELELQVETLKLLGSGANVGIAILNDVPRRYAAAEGALALAKADEAAERENMNSIVSAVAAADSGKDRELEEANLRLGQAEAALKVAQGNFDNAQKYFDDHIITYDKYKAATDELDRRKLDYDAAVKIVAQVTEVVSKTKAEGQARIKAQDEAIKKAQAMVGVRQKEFDAVEAEYKSLTANGSPQGGDPMPEPSEEKARAEESRKFMVSVQEAKVKAAQAALEEVQAAKGVREYKAPFSGKIGWIKAREGDVVGANDFVLTVFRTEGMEVQARFPQDTAGNIAKGQRVNVKLLTENGYIHINGKVEAITNEFYTLPPQDRQRVRVENPRIEMNMVVVRISLEEGKGKEALYPGNPVTVTIFTNK